MVPKQNICLLLVGYLVIPFLCMPLAVGASNSIIWENGDQIVRLAPQDNDSTAANDHPKSLNAGEIAAMLKTLRLRFTDQEADADSISVFTQEELDNLGSAVAIGLGRATPSQDIIFHVIGTRRTSPGSFTKRNRVSAGRIFYRDGKINIIFGQVQTPYRKKNIYGQIDQDFYPRNYGSRKQATKHDVVLLSNNAVNLTRNDWLVIEPGVAAATAIVKAQATVKPVPTPAPASSAAPVALAEAPARPSSPAASSNTDAAKQQAAGTSADSTGLTADVEERLEALKRLRERELISEEAYQAKMKEILQDL